MKNIEIDFFSVQENKPKKESKEKAVKDDKPALTGYISPSGKLVLPARTVAQLAVDIDNTSFKVGKQQGKRKAKSLYMVPDTENQTDTFRFTKAAKSYTMLLPVILQNNGVDYLAAKYTFTVNPMSYNGGTALELKLTKGEKEEAEPKKPYTGKPRGRKPKVQESGN